MNKEEYLGWSRELRDNWSDEIPSSIVRGGRFKVRKNWFQEVFSNIEVGLIDGFLGEEYKQAHDDLVKYCEDTDLSYRLTTEEDIGRANEVLTSIINSLEQAP